MIVRHSKVVLTFAKDSPEIRQTDRKLRKKLEGIRKKFGSIRNHLKGLTFFSNSPGQSYHFWRICREYKCFTFARYSPQCESSIIFATPHERPRILTNTYEHLAIILRSLRLVANWIRKPIRHIFAIIWRICREYFFLHSQGYSPQCETIIKDVFYVIAIVLAVSTRGLYTFTYYKDNVLTT